MRKEIEEYIPEYEDEVRVVQARVPKSLADSVDKIRKRKHLKWTELINSCLAKFADDINSTSSYK